MHLQNPKIKWNSSPMAPHFSASITSQLNNVGDRVGKEKKTRTIASPTFVVRPGPAPPPFLGRGQSLGESQERRPQAGGVVVPGGRKRRKKLLPLRPTPPHTPRSPPQAPGTQQTGWRWGQGGQGQSSSSGPGSAWPAGGEGFTSRRTP